MNIKQKVAVAAVGLTLMLPTSASVITDNKLPIDNQVLSDATFANIDFTSELAQKAEKKKARASITADIPELEVAIEVIEVEEVEVIEEVIDYVEPVQYEEVAVVAPVSSPAPSGSGAGIVGIALAQEGFAQDCTDLVQNSLAQLGLTTRRDQGGYDYGVRDFTAFGYEIPWTEAAPGDIAFIGPNNGGHVWIITDPANNFGVHGGWINGITYVSHAMVPLSAHVVIRLY